MFSFWLDDKDSHHIGKLETTDERKRELAQASLAYNLAAADGTPTVYGLPFTVYGL